MKVCKLVVASIVLLALSGSAFGNLLLNAGFEAGVGFAPSNWTRWGEGQVAREGWAARSGSFGLAFYGWTTLGGGAFQDVSISGISNYTFSIWGARDTNFTRPVTMGLEFYTAGLVQLTQYVANVGGSPTWQQFSITAPNPTNAAIARVVMAFPDGGGGQAFRWDDASLTSQVIPEPTSVALFGLGLLALHGVVRRVRT